LDGPASIDEDEKGGKRTRKGFNRVPTNRNGKGG